MNMPITVRLATKADIIGRISMSHRVSKNCGIAGSPAPPLRCGDLAHGIGLMHLIG
jgi:hypothetical protein